MTALSRLASSPLAWRILIATIIAASVVLFARLPQMPSLSLAALTNPEQPFFQKIEADLPLPELPIPDSKQNLVLDQSDARQSNALMPIGDLHPEFAKPYFFSGTTEARLRARDCLAAASWYEAGDNPSDQRAVIQVILNRARHPAFPNSVCGVVFQGSQRRTGCQFTFTCDGALARRPSPNALLRARALAESALSGSVDAAIGLATHYHADYVVPYWRKEMVKISQRGAHIFYRWSGFWGTPKAMSTRAGLTPEPSQSALAFMSDMHAPETEQLESAQYELPTPTVVIPFTPHIAAAAPVSSQRTPALEMQLDLGAPAGSYALKALTLCGKAKECRVAGKIMQNTAFVYIRNANGAAEGLYWDCTRFQRNDNAQCMPNSTSLERLLMAS